MRALTAVIVIFAALALLLIESTLRAGQVCGAGGAAVVGSAVVGR